MIKLKSIFGKGDTGGSIISSLNQTNLILVEIQKQMSLDFASRISDQKQQVISEKRRISRDKFALQEGIVETVRNIKSKVKQATEVVTRPVRNIFARILDFLKVLSAGIAVNGIFKWLSDPENRKKLMGWFNVIKDHWKWILGTLVTLIGLKLGSKLIGPLRILTTIGAFLGKRLLPLLGKVALVLGAVGIGKFIGNIAREVGEEIKGDGDSWWRNILSIPLLNFANLMDILWAPFQAIKEYIVAGGDIEKSNKKMAEYDATLRENWRKTWNSVDFLDIIPNEPGSLGVWEAYGVEPIEGMAMGGSVKSNKPYIVGEKGPELFVPNLSGSILNNRKTEKIYKLLSNDVMRGNSVQTIQLPDIVNPPKVSRTQSSEMINEVTLLPSVDGSNPFMKVTPEIYGMFV